MLPRAHNEVITSHYHPVTAVNNPHPRCLVHGGVRIGFNLCTASMYLSLVLSLFTEYLYFEYFRNGVGYVVATSYLSWALISWYFFLSVNARSRLSEGE